MGSFCMLVLPFRARSIVTLDGRDGVCFLLAVNVMKVVCIGIVGVDAIWCLRMEIWCLRMEEGGNCSSWWCKSE